MRTFRLFAISGIVFVYLVTYTVWQIQFATKQKLIDWLTVHRSLDLHPFLEAAGIWSIEDIAARSIASLPEYITKNSKVLLTYTYLKDTAGVDLMLPLWLKDRGLGNYASIHNCVDLVALSHKYPGEIFYAINELEHLTPPERGSLRKDVHDFRTATGDFFHIPQQSLVMDHKQKYAKLITSWTWRYGPKHIESLKVGNKMQWTLVTLFITTSFLLLWLALPKGIPAHGAYILPTLATYWIIPEWGKLNIMVMLLLRSFQEPARMTLFSGILYIWMMAANDVISSQLVLLFSVLPTLAFLSCINSLRLQPSATPEECTRLFDLTISGIGYIDSEVRNFLKANKVSWLYTKLAASVPEKLEWDKIQRIKTEEVDVQWDIILDAIEPSRKSNSLKVIWLADNYAVTDDDAPSIGKVITKNKGLDTLRITYNQRPSILDLFYRLLLWNQNKVNFTNEGALTILDVIAEAEDCKLKTLDFCGVHLKLSFVKKIKESPKLKDINILVNKKMVTDGKPTVEIISYILNKVCLMFIIICTAFNIYNIINPTHINIFFNTWMVEMFTEHVYPHLEQLLQPYLHNLSLPGSFMESAYS